MREDGKNRLPYWRLSCEQEKALTCSHVVVENQSKIPYVGSTRRRRFDLCGTKKKEFEQISRVTVE